MNDVIITLFCSPKRRWVSLAFILSSNFLTSCTIQISDAVAIDRVCNRRVDPTTGTYYHLTFRPPPSTEILNRLEKHPEDTEDSVQATLYAWRSVVPELQDFYTEVSVV